MGSRRGVVFAAAMLSLWLWSQPAAGANLTSAGGMLFDFDDHTGTLINGTSDSWDGCYALSVNGTGFRAPSSAVVRGRRVAFPAMDMGVLRVTRSAFVPDEAGRDYARYVDFVENTSSGTLTVNVQYSGNLGSDSSTTVFRTSSGDRSVDARDEWFGTDDVDGSRDPSLIHAFFGRGARVRPVHQSLSSDSISVQYSVQIRPGETVAFMVFVVQTPNQREALRQMTALSRSADTAVRDLAPQDTGLLVNWTAYGSGFGSVLTAELPAEIDMGEGAGDEAAPAPAVDFERSAARAAPEEPPELAPIAPQPVDEMVYRAQLGIATTDVRDRIRQASDLAAEMGGHVLRQDERTVVIRVLAERFRQALERAEALGDVLRRRVAVEDVSERVRDLRIRLQTATELRDRLTELLDDTETVEEALTVQRELERLNRTIELLTAELASLEEQVRYSTIAIYFQPIGVRREVPVERFALPFPWLDRLGLEHLLDVR